jgi:hypothetical protein
MLYETVIGCRLMIDRKLLVVLSLATSFKLCSPLFGSCLGTCRSRTESCHTWTRHQLNSQTCPHSKLPSEVSVSAASGCDCTVDGPQVPVIAATVTTESCRNEFSKASGVALHQPAQLDSTFPETRPSAPPLLLPLTGQSTFLVNSSLRI